MARNLEKYRVRVLCEDKAQYSFIRGFLTSQGVESDRRISPCRDLPEGTKKVMCKICTFQIPTSGYS